MHSRLLRLSLRFVLPLAMVLGLSAYVVVPLVDDLTLRWFIRDLDTRSQSLANALQDPLQEYVPAGAEKKITQLFDRAMRDERLYAIAFCGPDGALLYKTATYPKSLGCRLEKESDGKRQSLVRLPEGALHVSVSPVENEGRFLGNLVLAHDMSFIERRSADTKRYVITLFAVLTLLISLVTVFIAHLSWRNWIASMKGILRGEIGPRPQQQSTPPEILPLEGDLRALLHEYQLERRTRDDANHLWTPEKLRALLHEELAGDEVLVVSNREPYLHVRTRKGIEVQRPASGLVTAVEPVMRACSGTWIAHGSGSADRDAVDRFDRVPVPPGHPSYTLRRVWLSKEEEQGYYYGFANEGLWPLCHIAHVRPVFRSSDWEQYVAVNRRFADAVIKEART
ncbi:MAG: trehalose-6-phosphate synthase, partial [Bacillota bacterium]